MIDEKFGLVLRELRLKNGWSQEEFALNVGLHRTYISQLERGLKSPSLTTINKICVELNINVSKLIQMVEDK